MPKKVSDEGNRSWSQDSSFRRKRFDAGHKENNVIIITNGHFEVEVHFVPASM